MHLFEDLVGSRKNFEVPAKKLGDAARSLQIMIMYK